jgi:outer membrane protein TolC
MFRHLFVSLLLAGPVLAPAEPLSLPAALEIAQQSAADLAMADAEVAASTAQERAAGRLPDPKLTVGIENVPIDGPDRWSLTRDAMTMRTLGLMQEVPNGARRAAETEVARAAVERAVAEQHVRRLEIRRNTALAWLDRYYVERRGALLDELDRENRLFADAIDAQLAGGRARPADALAPRVEAAELADRRDELAGAVATSRAALRRWVGAAADEPLGGEPPPLPIDAGRLRAHVHAHPELAVFVPMTQMAQAEVHAAEAAKRPDWAVELAYGRRAAVFGDMVSLQFTVGLPLFAGTRQNPLIEARRHALARVEAERDAMLREHTEGLEVDLADYETLTRQFARMQDVRLPLAQQKVDLLLAAYRGGQLALDDVLAARRESIELALAALDLEGRKTRAAAKLYYIYGEGAK